MSSRSFDARSAFIRSHVWKACIYYLPKSHTQLVRERNDPTLSPYEHNERLCELSREELAAMKLTGTHVLMEHIGNEDESAAQVQATGVVVAKEQNGLDGSMYVYFRLFDNARGWYALSRLETAELGMKGFSLGHRAWDDGTIVADDVSYCFVGKRPGTWLAGGAIPYTFGPDVNWQGELYKRGTGSRASKLVAESLSNVFALFRMSDSKTAPVAPTAPAAAPATPPAETPATPAAAPSESKGEKRKEAPEGTAGQPAVKKQKLDETELKEIMADPDYKELEPLLEQMTLPAEHADKLIAALEKILASSNVSRKKKQQALNDAKIWQEKHDEMKRNFDEHKQNSVDVQEQHNQAIARIWKMAGLVTPDNIHAEMKSGNKKWAELPEARMITSRASFILESQQSAIKDVVAQTPTEQNMLQRMRARLAENSGAAEAGLGGSAGSVKSLASASSSAPTAPAAAPPAAAPAPAPTGRSIKDLFANRR